MGILTGKFTAETQFGAGDFRQSWQDDPAQSAVFHDDLEKVEQLRSLAGGRSLAQLAVQFVLAHPAVSTVIPGAKHAQQIRETAQAVSMPPLTEDELAMCAGGTPPAGGRKKDLAGLIGQRCNNGHTEEEHDVSDDCIGRTFEYQARNV
jgi:aryl-alcohol dehydrogenase-like predicted oxidoreductase